jgi:hypothetical protein
MRKKITRRRVIGGGRKRDGIMKQRNNMKWGGKTKRRGDKVIGRWDRAAIP